MPAHELHHGRRMFAKVQQKRLSAAADMDVRLYFQDGRSGEAFRGWWFGAGPNSEVTWAHCKSTSYSPPSTGWKTPRGDAFEHMFVVPQEASATAERREAEEVACDAVRSAERSLEAARKVLPGFRHPSSEALSKVMRQVQDLQRCLMDGEHPGNGLQPERSTCLQPSAALAAQLVARLEHLRTVAKEELDAVSAADATDEAEAKVSRLVDDDRVYWQQSSLEARKSLERAKAHVDDVHAEFEVTVVSGDGDQLESMFSRAQKSIREACAVVKRKYSETGNLVTLQVREEVCAELGKQLEELQTAQENLTDLRCLAADRFVSQEAARIAEIQKPPSSSNNENTKGCRQQVATLATTWTPLSENITLAGAPGSSSVSSTPAAAIVNRDEGDTRIVDGEPPPACEEALLKRLASKGLLQRVETPETVLEKAAAQLKATPRPDAGAAMPELPKKLFLCQKHGLSAVIRFAKGRRRFFCCPLPKEQGSCGFQRWMDRKAPRECLPQGASTSALVGMPNVDDRLSMSAPRQAASTRRSESAHRLGNVNSRRRRRTKGPSESIRRQSMAEDKRRFTDRQASKWRRHSQDAF